MRAAGNWFEFECILVLPHFLVGVMLTGSADKTIKMWKGGACQKTLGGHTDCIRGLAVLSPEEFLSCANDCTVKRWTSEGQCTGTFHGHENYVYSMALMPNGVDFVTSGEDRTVRVWVNGEVGLGFAKKEGRRTFFWNIHEGLAIFITRTDKPLVTTILAKYFSLTLSRLRIPGIAPANFLYRRKW